MQNTNSKLNTALLIIIIILLAVGIFLLINKKNNPSQNVVENTDGNQVISNALSQTTKNEYKNTQLGFSFDIPDKFGSVKTYNNGPIESPGNTGQSMRGYLSYSNPVLYFAGITPNYTAPRDLDCGEMKSVDAYKEASSIYNISLNSQGEQYVYVNVTSNEMEGPHQVAYFKLSKGPFPVLGFCGIGMTQEEFKKVVDTVVIQ